MQGGGRAISDHPQRPVALPVLPSRCHPPPVFPTGRPRPPLSASAPPCPGPTGPGETSPRPGAGPSRRGRAEGSPRALQRPACRQPRSEATPGRSLPLTGHEGSGVSGSPVPRSAPPPSAAAAQNGGRGPPQRPGRAAGRTTRSTGGGMKRRRETARRGHAWLRGALRDRGCGSARLHTKRQPTKPGRRQQREKGRLPVLLPPPQGTGGTARAARASRAGLREGAAAASQPPHSPHGGRATPLRRPPARPVRSCVSQAGRRLLGSVLRIR